VSRTYDVVIIGAGPAGCATALALAHRSRRFIENTLVIDKAVFPRPKLCGGGLTHTSSRALALLGVELDINATVIRELELIVPKRRHLFVANDFFRTVSRESFDHLLLREARARGIQVNEGEALLNWEVTEDAVIVRTSKGEHRAKIVVGADGANSMVRRRLGLHDPAHVAMALEISVTDPDAARFQTPPNRATFDFRPILDGIHGYSWKFPAGSEAVPRSLIGIGDFAYHAQTDKGALARTRKSYILNQATDVRNVKLQGHTIRLYNPEAAHGGARFILVGDAVGTDALWADGIGSALCMGQIAASAIEESIERDQYLSHKYEVRLRTSGIGRLMRARLKVAEEFYGKGAPSRYLAADWAWRHVLKHAARPSF
jgi:menaquinone-9 beta-reductase